MFPYVHVFDVISMTHIKMRTNLLRYMSMKVYYYYYTSAITVIKFTFNNNID